MSPNYEQALFDELFRLVDQSGLSKKEIAWKAKLSVRTIYNWRNKNRGLFKTRVDTLDRWLRVLGYKLAIVPVTPYNSNDE